MSPRFLGLAAAAATLALDQASKLAMLHFAGEPGAPPLVLAPFLDLTLAWNPGISYSLFAAHSAAGRLALLGFTAVAVALLGVWLWRARGAALALGLGAIIGGALGNACDRVVYGKVADFLHLHFGGFSPFGVNNVADIAIFAGVALLLYDSFFGAASSGKDGSASLRL